jgi:hypothetical protein
MMNFALRSMSYTAGILTSRKILWHGADRFTSFPKKGVLRIFIALKIHRPRPGLNSRTLGPVVMTLSIIPPKTTPAGVTRQLWSMELLEFMSWTALCRWTTSTLFSLVLISSNRLACHSLHCEMDTGACNGSYIVLYMPRLIYNHGIQEWIHHTFCSYP